MCRSLHLKPIWKWRCSISLLRSPFYLHVTVWVYLLNAISQHETAHSRTCYSIFWTISFYHLFFQWGFIQVTKISDSITSSDSHPLALIANELKLIAETEFTKFSTILCSNYSEAGRVAFVLLHLFYGERLVREIILVIPLSGLNYSFSQICLTDQWFWTWNDCKYWCQLVGPDHCVWSVGWYCQRLSILDFFFFISILYLYINPFMKISGPVGSLTFLFSQKLKIKGLVAGQSCQGLSGVVNNHQPYSKTQSRPFSENETLE